MGFGSGTVAFDTRDSRTFGKLISSDSRGLVKGSFERVRANGRRRYTKVGAVGTRDAIFTCRKPTLSKRLKMITLPVALPVFYAYFTAVDQ